MKPVASKLTAKDGSEYVYFYCPGCGDSHGPRVTGPGASVWGWNGSLTAPTFTPSILCTAEHGIQREKRVCHSFVTDGKIQFLSDCTHALAGKTVELQPIEDRA